MKNFNKTTINLSIFSTIIALVFAYMPAKVSALTNNVVEKCAFSRDLDLGIEGEDVKCLQKFLNNSGFVIANTGVGSPGKETGQLKSLTQQALINWQKSNGILPATGYFGAKSRSKYAEIIKNIANNPVVSGTGANTPKVTAVPGLQNKSIDDLNKELAELLKKANTAKNTSNTDTIGSPTAQVSSSEKEFRTTIQQAIKDLDDAKAQIKRGKNSGKDVNKAISELSDAREDFVSAISSYFANDFAKAVVRARDASHNALDALESAGGVSKENKADELISDVEDKIDDAEDKIHDADRKGEDVDDAEKLLDKAKASIALANRYFEDNKFSDAETEAEKAEDIVADALDAIGSDSKDKAKDAISDAEDLIDDVKNLIRKAKNRGDNVTQAERYYNKATSYLDNAQDQFRDKNYVDALDSARQAKSQANDAKDEL